VETYIGEKGNDTPLVETGIGGKGKGLLLVETCYAPIQLWGNKTKSGFSYVINIILGTLVLALLMLILSVIYKFKFVNRNRYRYMVEAITGPRNIIRETEFNNSSNYIFSK